MTDGVSRRAALVGVGALAAGVAAEPAAAAPTGQAAPRAQNTGPGFNVRDYGAAGDGVRDDTTAIQTAIDAARVGGGTVLFPPGTYLTRRLTLHSRVHLRGPGGDAAVLRLAPGANSAIVESAGFGELTGTRSDGGITMFSVRDLALDGNREQNPDAGYGLRLYGYGYELTEVIAFNCRDDGVYSEWGRAGALPAPSHQMEARLTAVRSHDNGGCGLNFTGPHDSMLVNCLAFQNRGTGFSMTGDSAGTSMVNCHAWGIVQDLAFELAASGIGCVNCYADLNGGIGVRISGNDCRWIGGFVLGYNHPGPQQEIGIQFAPGPRGPAGSVVDTKIMNCATAAVDFGADKGNSVRASLWQPGVPDGNGTPVPGTGRGFIGTPARTSLVEITQGLGDTERNLVIRPAFDLREQAQPPRPGADAVRIFARDAGGRTQLCALFASGAVRVIATE